MNCLTLGTVEGLAAMARLLCSLTLWARGVSSCLGLALVSLAKVGLRYEGAQVCLKLRYCYTDIISCSLRQGEMIAIYLSAWSTYNRVPDTVGHDVPRCGCRTPSTRPIEAMKAAEGLVGFRTQPLFSVWLIL